MGLVGLVAFTGSVLFVAVSFKWLTWPIFGSVVFTDVTVAFEIYG